MSVSGGILGQSEVGFAITIALTAIAEIACVYIFIKVVYMLLRGK